MEAAVQSIRGALDLVLNRVRQFPFAAQQIERFETFIALVTSDLRVQLTYKEKFIFLLSTVYLICPIDLIPDVIPIVGYVDDIFVVGSLALFISSFFNFIIAYRRALAQLHAKPLFEPAEDEDCVICFGENGPRITQLMPCGHLFCRNCAEQLCSRRMLCPFCRRNVDLLRDKPHQHPPEQQNNDDRRLHAD